VEAGSSDYARFDSFPVDETWSWRIALDATSNRRTELRFFNEKNTPAAEPGGTSRTLMMMAARLGVSETARVGS
jgi:uncharacterized lipoprotein YbaY